MSKNVHADARAIGQRISDDIDGRTNLHMALAEAAGVSLATIKRHLDVDGAPENLTVSEFLHAVDLLGDGDAVAYLQRCLGVTPPDIALPHDDASVMRDLEILLERVARRGFRISLR